MQRFGVGVKTQNPSNCKKGGVEFPRSKFGDGFCRSPDIFGVSFSNVGVVGAEFSIFFMGSILFILIPVLLV